MEPLVQTGPPRRILFLDYETPIEVMREDLLKMESVLTIEEMDLMGRNLLIYNFANPAAEEINLNRPQDRELLAKQAKQQQVDLIIIDPITLAFIGTNEQDNTMVADKIFAPLRKLGRVS